MRRIVPLVFVTALAACQPPVADYGAVFDGTGGRWVDLTHAFSASTIYWPTDLAGFQLEQLAFGPTESGWFYTSYRFASAEHGGTHLDAPIHFAEDRLTNDQIPLSGLIGPPAVVDVTAQVTPDYLVSVSDLTRWEAVNGQISDGAILLYPHRLGRPLDRPHGVSGDRPHRGRGGAGAALPRDRRRGRSVGRRPPIGGRRRNRHPEHRPRSVHRLPRACDPLRENISGFENVANLSALPATGSYVVALPMKIEGGSDGPLRIVAFVPRAADL